MLCEKMLITVWSPISWIWQAPSRILAGAADIRTHPIQPVSAPDAVLESEAIPLPVVAVMLLIWTIASFILSVYDPRRGYKPMEETQAS